MLRHVVLFNWKSGTPEEKIREIEEAFCALPAKIPQIEDFEWGEVAGGRAAEQGFDHCFVVTVADRAALEAYLPHPDHAEFLALNRPHVGELLTIDYFATEADGRRR
jgi:hypothetical protein